MISVCRLLRLFDLRLQIAHAEPRTGLHRRIFDEGGKVLGGDLGRDLESLHLVLEGVPVANRALRETIARPVHAFERIMTKIGQNRHVRVSPIASTPSDFPGIKRFGIISPL
ncbi:hypothetical protein [Labrys miyagiensis]|uniref:hypothetical protein n=1 Tax=Labrys miyagiensis TaxID=346912 RepID=UPI0024E16C1B|nr:hypothetical protein [Labrys miyagiensis]